MEKIMIKRHRDHRPERDGKRSYSKNAMAMATNKRNQPQINGHGLKRSGSHSCKEDNHKVSKHQHKNEFNSMQQPQENVNVYTPLQQCSAMQTNTSTDAVPINVNNNIYQPPVSYYKLLLCWLFFIDCLLFSD